MLVTIVAALGGLSALVAANPVPAPAMITAGPRLVRKQDSCSIVQSVVSAQRVAELS